MKRTMLSVFSTAVVFAALATAPSAYADCSQSKLAHTYGFLAQGHDIVQEEELPYAAGGLLTFREDGTFSLVGTQSVNGVVGPVSPNEGQYVIGANCKGSATVGGNAFFDFVVVGNGNRIEFIRSDVGHVITGYAKRKANECSLSNVKGVYGYAFNAIVFNLPLNNETIDRALFTGGGTVGLDKTGHAILDDTASFGGFVLQRHYEGTVEVDSDCTGSATVTLPENAPTSTNPVHVDAVWVDERKSVILIQTDQGTYIAGEATQLNKVPAPKPAVD